MPEQGLFIAIEGGDGSGKGTQSELLGDYLIEAGYNVVAFDFPRYEDDSSIFIREYLNGEYGDLDDIGPKKGSLFFAMDRFGASFDIRSVLDEGGIVLSNRYVASNMAHQGSKIEGREERVEYFEWLHELEYGILGIPQPDLNVVLHVPALVGQRLVAEKEERAYLNGKSHDIHEADINHLQQTEQVYLELCELFPEDFWLIECINDDEELMSVEEIQAIIRSRIEERINAQENI